MEWRTRPGTMLLELVHAAQVLARIDGPHPGGFALTVPPRTSCVMFGSVDAAKRAAEAELVNHDHGVTR